ncbi:MAG: NADH-quinone oxidoreductase subunit N, partial [bacterium]
VSLPSYVMAGYNRDNRASAEAGIKYLLYGSISGGVFLYGATLLYGVTGQFTLGGISQYLSAGGGVGVGFYTGLIFMLIGIGYKCSFFPMHMWVPDVYQGAPTAVGGFLSTAPKAAGLAVLMRMSYSIFPHLIPEGSETLIATAVPLFFFFISAVTMTIANLSALLQSNVKRLLGYSTIAHVGYMLMAYTLIGTGDLDLITSGFSAISFYLIIYTLMNLGAFLVVLALDREWLDEFDGMFVRSPISAIAMAIFLFSLTGLPPLAGFVGKFSLFSAVIQSQSSLFYTLAVIGVLNSVISLFYYANVLRHMFLNAPETEEAIVLPKVSRALLVVLAGAVLILGILWGGVFNFSQNFMQAYQVHGKQAVQTADIPSN